MNLLKKVRKGIKKVRKGISKFKNFAGQSLALANKLNSLGILPPGMALGLKAVNTMREYEKKSGKKLKFGLDEVEIFRKQAKIETIKAIKSGKIKI